MVFSIAGVLVAGGLLGWLLLGGDGNDEEVDDGNAGQQPTSSVSPTLSKASEFAPEYVLHAIDGDHAWLRERTIDGWYDFSSRWFERLAGCDAEGTKAGSAVREDDSSTWIAAVTFDPPCEPGRSEVVGTTFTLVFEDTSVTSADVGQALAELGHDEAQVLTTSDGAFIIRTAELEGLPGPPIGSAPPSERDIIEQALRESLGDFQVLNFSQFVGAGGAGPYACVLLRVEDNVESKATITRWPTDEAQCSPDSPNFGSGFGDPSLGPAYVLLEADTSRLAPGMDIGNALKGVKDVLERRADSFGAPIELRREGSNRLSAVMWGIDPDEARELLGKTAQLEFLKPVRDDVGNVVCETPSGSTYAQSYQPGQFVEDEVNDTVTCRPNEEGTVGVVVWEPATGTDSQGTQRALTGSFLKANSRVEGPPPTVVIEFTGEGGLLFEQITTELIGLPLGIFLDEDLVGAPTVSQPITGGSSTITGLDFDEARTLSIQLNAGALPIPIRTIQEFRLESQGLPVGTPMAIRSLWPRDGETTATALPPPSAETPIGLTVFEAPESAIDTSRSYEAVIETDRGDILIALNPDSPEAVNSFSFLAGQVFYDGLDFFWVLPGFDIQAGDPTCGPKDVACTGSGGPGYTLPLEATATGADQWSVIAPVMFAGSDTVHGSQFVIVMADGLQIEGTLVGKVLAGQELLQSLPQRTPCFGAQPGESNPCQTNDGLPPALTILGVVVQPS